MWSAATCRRFTARMTCQPGSIAFSGASQGQRACELRSPSFPAGPLCAALPKRHVAQAVKAETSLRTPKLRGSFSHTRLEAARTNDAPALRGAARGDARPTCAPRFTFFQSHQDVARGGLSGICFAAGSVFTAAAGRV